MRVLHVLPRLAIGGAERVVADLIRWQMVNGFEPHLCVLGPPPSEMPAWRPDSVEFLGWRGSLRNIAGVSSCIRDLHRLVRRLNPQVIHAHLWPAALMAAGHGRPLMVHVHDSRPWLESPAIRHKAKRTLHRLTLNAADARLVAVSDAVKQHAAQNLRWPGNSIQVVHNGIDVEYFHGMRTSDERRFTVGAVGRLVPEKGFDYLIRAAGHLHHSGVALRLLIAGDGSQRVVLEEMIAQSGLGDAIQLVGTIADVRSFYKQLDVFVLPSISSEGLPISVLEAMSMSLPVIATNVGGTSEAILNGWDGLLVPPSNVTALADAMLTLFDDPHLRRQLGDSARRRVCSQFTFEQMGRGVAEQYRALAA